MAELLMRNVGLSGAEHWTPGDCCVIRGDGWQWGKREAGVDNTRFILVKLPGVDPDTLSRLLESVYDASGSVIAKRKQELRYADTPQSFKATFTFDSKGVLFNAAGAVTKTLVGRDIDDFLNAYVGKS